jgi:hypothetical protein
MNKTKLLLCLVVVGLTYHVRAQDKGAAQLDYERTVRAATMVQIPYVELSKGPVFYTRYKQIISSSSKNAMDFKRLFVNLTPVVWQTEEYNDFIRTSGFADANVLPVEAASACSPSEKLRALLAYLPEAYSPKVLKGNYPILCTLSVYFLPEDESAVRALIDDKQALDVHASVPLCAANSPWLDINAIVDVLLASACDAENPIVRTDDGGITGRQGDVLCALNAAAKDDAELFEKPGSDSKTSRKLVMSLFKPDPSNHRIFTMSPEIVQLHKYYSCSPEPLDISF